MKDSFRYDRSARLGVATIRGQQVEIRAPEARARRLFEALCKEVDERGLLYSPPMDARPKVSRGWR